MSCLKCGQEDHGQFGTCSAENAEHADPRDRIIAELRSRVDELVREAVEETAQLGRAETAVIELRRDNARPFFCSESIHTSHYTCTCKNVKGKAREEA